MLSIRTPSLFDCSEKPAVSRKNRGWRTLIGSNRVIDWSRPAILTPSAARSLGWASTLRDADKMGRCDYSTRCKEFPLTSAVLAAQGIA